MGDIAAVGIIFFMRAAFVCNSLFIDRALGAASLCFVRNLEEMAVQARLAGRPSELAEVVGYALRSPIDPVGQGIASDAVSRSRCVCNSGPHVSRRSALTITRATDIRLERTAARR